MYFFGLLGSLEYLKAYESKRQRHNVPTMLAVHGLQKLYNTTFAPLVVLRSVGLQLTHALPPLKVSQLYLDNCKRLLVYTC